MGAEDRSVRKILMVRDDRRQLGTRDQLRLFRGQHLPPLHCHLHSHDIHLHVDVCNFFVDASIDTGLLSIGILHDGVSATVLGKLIGAVIRVLARL